MSTAEPISEEQFRSKNNNTAPHQEQLILPEDPSQQQEDNGAPLVNILMIDLDDPVYIDGD